MNDIIIQNSINTPAATATPLTMDILARWRAFIDASPRTVETYTHNVRRFFEWAADNGIQQPQRADIIRYKEDLLTSHKPATVTGYIAALRIFFEWTSTEGVYPNIAAHIKGAKIGREFKKDYLTQSQARELLADVDTATLTGKRDLAMLLLMITTGLRTIEIERANIEDMKLTAGFTALYIQGKGKDGKSDYVKIPAEVEKAIRQYLKARGKQGANAPLFASTAHRNEGERLTTRSIRRIVKEHLRGAGFDSDRLTAHSLRHTAATLNLLAGGTLEETKQLLRHADISTTMIYSHALDRANNESENRIAAAIFG